MKLLITRSTPPHFYKVDPLEELVPINFGEHEIGQPSLEICRDLPWELCSMILHELFESHVRDFNFDLAAALVTINQSFAFEIYKKVYGCSTINPVTRVFRMCQSLKLVQEIHDNHLTVSRVSRFTGCQIVKKGASEKFVPWGEIHECYQISMSGVITDEEELVEQFETGEFNGDKVWVTGKQLKNGMYECSRFKHPIINLEILDVWDNNTCTSRFLRRSLTFRRFMNLLYLAYGPNVGINVAFDDSVDGNPFDVSQTGFIEF